MIYLIGGPPRSGKTILSKKISRKLGIPCISVDALETIVRAYTPKSQWKVKFPKNDIRNKTKQSNDLMYGSYTARKIMQAYIIQGKSVWKAIELFIECEIHEGNDYIFEGHQIHPLLVFQLKKKYGKNIREIFLIKTEPMNLVRGALKNKAASDWFIRKTRDEKTYSKIADMLCMYGEYIKKEAIKNKLTVVSTDTFQKGISGAMKYLVE